MGIKLEVKTDHEVSDVLWNPYYSQLYHFDWFPRVANRLRYSPFHPKTACIGAEYTHTVLEEIHSHIRGDSRESEVISKLISELNLACGRMGLLSTLMNDENTCLVCQKADRELFIKKSLFEDRVFSKFWSKAWRINEPETIIVTKKLQLSDISIDIIPDNIDKIIILSDKRICMIVEALIEPLFSGEGKYPELIHTSENNIPKTVKILDTEFPKSQSINKLEIAQKQFREMVNSLKKQWYENLQKEMESVEFDENTLESIEDLFIAMQAQLISTTEINQPPPSSRHVPEGSKFYLAETIEGKNIAIPIHTHIYIEKLSDGVIDEISSSSFNKSKHKLILLDLESCKTQYHQRASITRALLNDLDLKDLIDIGAFRYMGDKYWSDFESLLLNSSLLIRKQRDASEIIGDSILAEKIILYLRKNGETKFDKSSIIKRWTDIEEEIQLSDEEIPIPIGPERFYSKNTTELIFDVLIDVLQTPELNERSWGLHWAATVSLQTTRRNYIKKLLAKDQKSYDIVNWDIVTAEKKLPYYEFFDY